MRLLRNGLATIAEAAQIAVVSRQRVLEWCNEAGIDVRATRRLWLARQIVQAEEEQRKMDNRNKRTQDKRHHPGMMAPLLRSTPSAPQPSKAQLKAEAAKAMAKTPVEVKRVATVHTFRCLDCREYNRRRPELKCGTCGSTNVQRAV